MRINGHSHLPLYPEDIPIFMKEKEIFWVDDERRNMLQKGWKQSHRIKSKIKFSGLTLILLCSLFWSCNSNNCTEGSGRVLAKNVEVDFFWNLTNSTLVDVLLVADSTASWQSQIKGYENLLDVVVLDIQDERLVVRQNENCISTDRPLEFFLQDRTISSIVNSSSGNVSGVAGLNDPEIRNSGSGNVRLTNGRLTGPIQITNSGSGNVDTNGIDAEAVTITNSGPGDVFVTASGTLDVTISGSGDVYFKGDPIINSIVSGTGELIDNN